MKERNIFSFSVRGLISGLLGRSFKPAQKYRLSRSAVEDLVGFRVGDMSLYEKAMRHRSLLRNEPEESIQSNERLEFLGDAVLGFITAEHLFHRFPDKNEGFLTRLRAKLVNGKALAHVAERIELGSLILMSKNMDQEQGRQNRTILADAFEALVGAIYLDQGLDAARRFIRQAMLDHVDLLELSRQYDNYKSLLLEYAQARGWPQPYYRVISEQGPSHAKVFTVEAVLKGEAMGKGRGGSKKLAEQEAAREALKRLNQQSR